MAADARFDGKGREVRWQRLSVVGWHKARGALAIIAWFTGKNPTINECKY